VLRDSSENPIRGPSVERRTGRAASHSEMHVKRSMRGIDFIL